MKSCFPKHAQWMRTTHTAIPLRTTVITNVDFSSAKEEMEGAQYVPAGQEREGNGLSASTFDRRFGD
jgi:hypothetical protein